MQHPLSHGQGTGTDLDHQQSCRLGIHSRPHPIRRMRQMSDRLVLAEVTILPGTEDGVELVHLSLAHVDLTQAIWNYPRRQGTRPADLDSLIIRLCNTFAKIDQLARAS